MSLKVKPNHYKMKFKDLVINFVEKLTKLIIIKSKSENFNLQSQTNMKLTPVEEYKTMNQLFKILKDKMKNLSEE